MSVARTKFEPDIIKMKELRIQGFSLAYIGNQFGTSRQRVKQILDQFYPSIKHFTASGIKRKLRKPQVLKPRVECVCLMCGKTSYHLASEIKPSSPHRFCSRKCFASFVKALWDEKYNALMLPK